MKNKGITLIALVITIVILIILAGISINLIFGESGILNKTIESRSLQKMAMIKEEIRLELSNIKILEERNGKEMSFSTKISTVYEKLQRKGLIEGTKKIGNTLIIDEKYQVLLTQERDAIEVDSSKWNYHTRWDGTATIYGYKGEETNITIPTYVIENNVIYPVTRIEQTWEDGRFYGNNTIKSIEMLDNIEIIETWAFASCSNLEEIVLPKGINEIGEGIFSQCRNLKSINIPSSVQKICKDAFSYCVGLKEINIPSNVEEIGKSAFGYCGNRGEVYLGPQFENGLLEKITLNDGLKIIREDAFINAMSVNYDLEIPSSATIIEENAFANYGIINNKKVYKNEAIYAGESKEYLNSPIQASFFECYMGHDFTEEDWKEELKEWEEMGIKYIVIGETMFKSSSDNKIYTYYPSTKPNTTMYYDAVGNILKYCKQANVKVFLSCGNVENTFKCNLCRHDSDGTLGQESFLSYLDETLPFIQELYDLYYNDYKDIIYGWFFTPEVSNSIDWEDTQKCNVGVETLSKGLNKTIEKIRSLNENFKIMLSPYLNVEEQASWCTRSTSAISNYWKEVINNTNFIEGDILAPQDSANNMKWDTTKLDLYTKAYRDAVDAANKKIQLWSNLELFVGYDQGIEDSQYIEYGQSTYLTYLDKQLKSQSPYVDNFMSCSFCYYYTKPNSIDGFYEAYKQYLKTGKIETQKPTNPTNVEVGTVEVNGKKCLNINFSGMKDNYGIARANIYKNGEFFTYRVSTRVKTYKLEQYVGKVYPRSFYDKYFNLENDTATYEIEVIDCCENKADGKYKFTITAKSGDITIQD